MADFVYDKSKNTLEGHGQTWTVRSGIPGSYSRIPNGLYTAPKGALMTGNPGYGVPNDPKYGQSPYSYRDKKGFSWFLWLGSGNLGIHPDGNVPGTKGCIGIVEDDSKPLFDKLKQLTTGTAITILVK
jgi:hypothetical protein